MDDQLHPPALVKKSFGDDRRLRRHIAQHGAPFKDVLNQLFSAREIEPAFFSQPTHGVRNHRQVPPAFHRSHARQPIADFFAQLAELCREL